MSTSLVFALAVLWAGQLPASLQQDEDIPHNEVKNWALKFGVDLWEFGRQFTKMNEIQRKYHDKDAEVARKDGLILIRELAAEVKNMMDIKMNAVMVSILVLGNAMLVNTLLPLLAFREKQAELF